jgi:uncharacterized protein
MHKLILFLFLLFVIRIQAKNTDTTSLLWQISGNGITRPSYLFGTMHLTCKDGFELNEKLKSAILKTNVLYEELLMEDMSSQVQMFEKMKSTSTLKQQMGDSVFNFADSTFKKFVGTPLTFFNNMKPFFASSMLSLKLFDCSKTVQPEMIILNFAKDNNIAIKGLETIGEQIEAIDKVPSELQVSSLIAVLKNIDSAKVKMMEMVGLYKKRDVEGLYNLTSTDKSADNFEKYLLKNRNKKWLKIIAKQCKTKSLFVAVGAAHLGGKNGLINLLIKKGFMLKPVMY